MKTTCPGGRLQAAAAAALAALMAVMPLTTRAQDPAPPVVSYQGYLTTPAGAPLSGRYNLRFRLYDVASGSDEALWEETHPRVDIEQGLFTVYLGAISPWLEDPDVREFDRPYWLGVSIDGGPELAPRLALASLPVAVLAKNTAATVTVNCPAESINEAINEAPAGGRLSVNITGNCSENVVIERDFVRLDGGGTATLTGVTPGAGPGNAVVFVDSARSLDLNGLTIRGAPGDLTGMHGVQLGMSSSASVWESSVIENHAGNGIELYGNSHLDLFDSIVQGNLGNGVHAAGGSSFDAHNADIRNNVLAGVHLDRRSAGTFTESTVVDNGNELAVAGIVKSALYLSEGSQARIHDDNTFRSGIANASAGGVILVSRGSSLRFAGSGVDIENTGFDGSTDTVVGAALEAYHGSVVRAVGDTVTIRGWIVTSNLTTVDLRNVAVEGDVLVGYLGNFRLRDQSGVPDRVSLTGNVRSRSGDLSIHNAGSSQAALIDGNVDCGGGFGAPSNLRFKDPDDGYVHCPQFAADLSPSVVAETPEPVSIGGAVTYDLRIDSLERSPAVGGSNVTLTVHFTSTSSFLVSGADAGISPVPGACSIPDTGTDGGDMWTGRVSCFFRSVPLSGALVRITVSNLQAQLGLDASTSTEFSESNPSNDTVSETTSVQ